MLERTISTKIYLFSTSPFTYCGIHVPYKHCRHEKGKETHLPSRKPDPAPLFSLGCLIPCQRGRESWKKKKKKKKTRRLQPPLLSSPSPFPRGRLRLQRQRRRRGSPSSSLLLSRAVGAIMEGEKECRTEGLRRRLLHPHSLPNHSLAAAAAAFLLSLRLFPRLPKEGDYRSPKKMYKKRTHQCCFNLDNSRFILPCYCAFGHCKSLSNLLPRRLRLDKLPLFVRLSPASAERTTDRPSRNHQLGLFSSFPLALSFLPPLLSPETATVCMG